MILRPYGTCTDVMKIQSTIIFIRPTRMVILNDIQASCVLFDLNGSYWIQSFYYCDESAGVVRQLGPVLPRTGGQRQRMVHSDLCCLQAGEHPWDCRIIHGFSRVLVLLGCWGGSRHEQVSCFCMDLRGMVVVWVVDNSEVEIDEITGF